MAPAHSEVFVFEWGSTNTVWHNAVHLGVRFFYMCTPKLIMELKTAGVINLLWSGGNWQSGWSSYNKLVTHFIWIRSKDVGLQVSTRSDHHMITGSCPTPFNSKCQLWLISLWGFHVKYSRPVHYHMILYRCYCMSLEAVRYPSNHQVLWLELVCSNSKLLSTLCKKTYEKLYKNMGSIVWGEPGNEATMCTW